MKIKHQRIKVIDKGIEIGQFTSPVIVRKQGELTGRLPDGREVMQIDEKYWGYYTE